MEELLDDFGGRGRLDEAGSDGLEERQAGLSKRMVRAFRVDEDGSVEDDQPRRPRICSSSARSSAGSGTGMSGAARIRSRARRFRSEESGNARSIAPLISAATDTPRVLASDASRS